MQQKQVDIREKAVLVHVKIQSINQNKFDREVTEEIARLKDSYDAGVFIKKLFGKEDIQSIIAVQGYARRIHHFYGLPWYDGGIRLLPTALFDDFSSQINEAIQLLDDAVDDVIARYDDIIQHARKRQGKMFNKEDYPTKEEIKKRFRIVVRFLPVPDKSDFRADMPQEIKDNFTQNDQFEDAVKAMWGKFRDVLEHAFEQLSKKKGKLFESVLSNLIDVVEILPALNIKEDPALNKLVKRAKALYADLEIKDLRENEDLREETATETKKILDKIGDYYAFDEE